MKKIQRILVILAVMVLCGGVFFATRNYYDKSEKEEPTDKVVEISGETIKASMENIGKLCTAEYNYTHVEQADSSREIQGFKIPFTTATFTYSYDGTIKAGIDFTKIQVEKNDLEKVITVTLPEAEIISSDLDRSSFKLYDEKNNIFNPITVTDVVDTIEDLKNSVEREAVEKGLLNKAKENAVTLVENFMQSTQGIENYKIEVMLGES